MADSVATDTLGSIVLVATSAWKVGTLSDNTGAREAAQTKLHSLMSKIFSQPSGRAWVRAHLPARYPDDQIRWASDEQAAERIRELTEEVVAAGVDARRRIDGGETLTMINGYRVLLDRKRFVALATTVGAANEIGAGRGPTASLAWLVSLDFRFYVTSGEAPEELRCSVLISVLSAAPRSGRYRPHDLDAERDHDEPHIRTSSLDTYRLDFTGVAAGAEKVIRAFWEPNDPRLFGRVHLPLFWVAVPAERAGDPATYLGDRIGTGRLAARLLDIADLGDSATSCDVLNGEFFVLRRQCRIPPRP